VFADAAPALALANSLGATQDVLATPAGVASWLETVGLGPVSGETALSGPELRDLRALVRDALGAVAEGREPSPGVLQRLNDVARSVPVVLELQPSVLEVREVPLARSPTARVLGALVRSAIRLLGSEARARVRRCPAPGCGRYFLLERAGRLWCSAGCGNRVRVARHLARRRDARGSGQGSLP